MGRASASESHRRRSIGMTFLLFQLGRHVLGMRLMALEQLQARLQQTLENGGAKVGHGSGGMISLRAA